MMLINGTMTNQVFSAMLHCDFRALPGEAQILQEMYHVTTDHRIPHLLTCRTWRGSISPGSKVAITVVLIDTEPPRTTCPRCGSKSQNFNTDLDTRTDKVVQYCGAILLSHALDTNNYILVIPFRILL